MCSVKLEETDVRGIVRIIGEIAGLRGGHAEKKRHLMERLCKMIDADAWDWALCQREPEKPQVYVSVLNGGFTEDGFVKLLQAVEHPGMVAATKKFFLELQEQKVHITRSRFQISTARQLKRSGAIRAWEEANIGPAILSHCPLDETSSSAVTLNRRFGRPEFSARESRIVHIMLSEIPWLHEQGWPEDRGVHVPALSKRQRLTLNLLINGCSQNKSRPR